MGKEIWVRFYGKPSEFKRFVEEAGEAVDRYLLDDGELVSEAEALGVEVVSKAFGGLRLVDRLEDASADTCLKVRVESREDEETVVEACRIGCSYVLVSCPDWKIIPLENLVAKLHGKTKIVAEASSVDEAETLLGILELGVDGVLVEARSLEDAVKIRELAEEICLKVDRIALSEARVLSVKPLKLGARVCLDTCDLFSPREGFLVGCQSSGLFLIEAEVHGNPYVEARPFRVNAGPPALYILAPLGKTRYLSELRAGETLLAVKGDGSFREVELCRVKIEWRPLKLVEAEFGGRIYKTIVQDAETIRFTTPDGSKPVTELKPGDTVLVYIQEGGGRHFGILVKGERVIER